MSGIRYKNQRENKEPLPKKFLYFVARRPLKETNGGGGSTNLHGRTLSDSLGSDRIPHT